jgi:TPR repeat protein
MKLAKKLVSSDHNKESCALRKTKAIDFIYRRMRSVLPQRIFMLGHNAWFLDQYITMAADMGHCEALMYYGYLSKIRYDSFLWRNSEKEEIFNTTVDYFTLAANQGHTEAQYMLSVMWTDRMPEEAKKWMELAATKGHVDAQYNLGCKYAESHQYEKAVGWLRLASAINANADVYLLRILADNPHLCQEKTELEIISTYNESNRSYENKMRWLCRHQPV